MINFRDEEQPHFLYMHFKATDGSPFYVGIGKKRYRNGKNISIKSIYERAFCKKERSDFWNNVVNMYGYDIEIVLDNLTAEEAREKEKEFIALYGRRNKHKGPLANLTDGGEGNVGYISSEATKKLLKDYNTIPLEQALFANSFPCPITGCYHWAGSFFRGRAYINQDSKSFPAAKYLYEHYNNIKLVKGQFAYMSCDNTNCVNPDHIALGNWKTRKKPHRSTFRQHRQVLTEELVREIRKYKEANPDAKATIISKTFKTSLPAVEGLLKGITWKWVV